MNSTELSKLSRIQLIDKCKELNLTKYSKKTKQELIELLCNYDNNYDDSDNNLKFIDLFCGIGGFHQALSNMNATCVFACDIDENCRKSYETNYSITPAGDITKIDINTIPAFDILCAGFPCFVENTKVLTLNGYKNIEQICLSDKVLSHTNTFRSILNLQKKLYSGELYEFKLSHQPNNIICTNNHPFYVREKINNVLSEPKKKKACDITYNDYFGMVINNESIIPEFVIDDEHIILNNLKQWKALGEYYSSGKTSLQFKYLTSLVDLNSIPEWMVRAPHIYINEFFHYCTINLYIRPMSYNLAYNLQRMNLKIGRLFRIAKKYDMYILYQSIPFGFIENDYLWVSPLKINVSETLNEFVYNFEVEYDNTYVVENTVTYNCQPFSKAGYQNGFDDERGNLFFDICKIVKHHKPKYLLLENVRNLASHDNGNTWSVIKDSIDKLNYHTYEFPVILNVLHFNIPQNRERVIIMCKRKDLGELPLLPLIPKNPKNYLTNTISSIIRVSEIETNNKYKITGKMKDVEEIWDKFIKLLILNKIQIPKYPIWTDWWDNNLDSDKAFYEKYTLWIDKNREFYNKNILLLKPWLEESRKCKNWLGAVRKFEWQAGNELSDDGMNKLLWTARGSGIRVKRPDYIPTLVAMSMIPIYGPDSRKLTPRELLRLQSFPDTFIFNEKTILKQVGNSVNVKMIEKCARFMILNEDLF
jgi:DNA (cytosine-5)-methyltransferase 1